jgi:hypothetical protein
MGRDEDETAKELGTEIFSQAIEDETGQEPVQIEVTTDESGNIEAIEEND